MGILNDIVRREIEKVFEEEMKSVLNDEKVVQKNVDIIDKKEPENVDENDILEDVNESDSLSQSDDLHKEIEDYKAQILDLQKQVQELQKNNRNATVVETPTDIDTIDSWLQNLDRLW